MGRGGAGVGGVGGRGREDGSSAGKDTQQRCAGWTGRNRAAGFQLRDCSNSCATNKQWQHLAGQHAGRQRTVAATSISCAARSAAAAARSAVRSTGRRYSMNTMKLPATVVRVAPSRMRTEVQERATLPGG